jgi:hypothetical protein
MSKPAGAQPLSARALLRVLSDARLESYRLSQSDSPRVLIGRYRWNVALSMSLYPVLFHLEVAFRNSVHLALSDFARTSVWYDSTPSVLQPREQDQVKEARAELVKQRQKRQQPAVVRADDVVAALNFGFWTSLLSPSYGPVLWHQRNMWVLAFPLLSRHERKRDRVSQRMHQIRILRNRVFHHEPIWHWRDLPVQHQKLRETITWFEPALLDLLPNAHTFDEIHAGGPSAYELDVQ